MKGEPQCSRRSTAFVLHVAIRRRSQKAFGQVVAKSVTHAMHGKESARETIASLEFSKSLEVPPVAFFVGKTSSKLPFDKSLVSDRMKSDHMLKSLSSQPLDLLYTCRNFRFFPAADIHF
jgi:hypothetical protein